MFACGKACECASLPLDLPVDTPSTVEDWYLGAAAERPVRLVLREESVLRCVDSPVGNSLGEVIHLAVGKDGTVYVADATLRDVIRFQPGAACGQPLGLPGEAPGSLRGPGSIAVASGFIWLHHRYRGRVIRWPVDQPDAGAIVPSDGWTPDVLLGELGGDLLVRRPRLDATHRIEALELQRVASDSTLPRSLHMSPPATLVRFRDDRVLLAVGGAKPQAAVDSVRGRVYLTDARTYRVLAIDANGTLAWSIEVSQDSLPPAPADVARALSLVRSGFPGARRDEFVWPDRPAISRILVDGHGRLLVFPYRSPWAGTGERPVDIYGPGGELVHRAVAPDVLWWAARGDLVYSVRKSHDSEDEEVVVYRLSIR